MNKAFLMASLMLVNVSSVMAQKNVFGNRQELTYEDDLIMFFSPPGRFLYGDNGGKKMMSFIFDVDENLVGYRVYNENLELEKELRTFTPGKGVIICESKSSNNAQWTEISRDTVGFDWTLVGYDDTSTNLWEVNAGQENDVFSMSQVNVTQTLFNDDEDYELIQPIHGESRVVSYDDDFTERTVRINTSITEYAITSEDGDILYSVKPRSGYVFGDAVSVIGVGDKNYFTVDMCDIAGEEELVCFYEIDKNTSSVKLVREISDYRWWFLIDPKFMFDKESRLIYGGIDDEPLFGEWTVWDKTLKEEKVFNIPNGEGFTTREKRNTDNGIWEETYREVDYSKAYLMSTPKLIMTSFYPDGIMGLHATITQTLFNNDDKYEIFTPVWGGKVVKYDDDYLSRETYTNYFVTAYNVVSEDGNVLHTLEAGGDCYFGCFGYVYDIYDKRYLLIPVFDASDVDSPYYDSDPSEATFRYYEINRETSSIDFICEVKGEMKVSPTVADKDDVITVALNTPKENAQMIVTSVSGQIVKRYILSGDEKSIMLSAASFRSGVYSISLHMNGTIIDSEKIIIK